jgi:hypothetical protein
MDRTAEASQLLAFVSWLRARDVVLAERSWGEYRPAEPQKIDQLAEEFARERAAGMPACICHFEVRVAPRCPRHGMSPP